MFYVISVFFILTDIFSKFEFCSYLSFSHCFTETVHAESSVHGFAFLCSSKQTKAVGRNCLFIQIPHSFVDSLQQ